MGAKQDIVHCRGPSNINLGIFVCSFDAGFLNHSPLLTMLSLNPQSLKHNLASRLPSGVQGVKNKCEPSELSMPLPLQEACSQSKSQQQNKC